MKIVKLIFLSLTIFVSIIINYLPMSFANDQPSGINKISSLLSDPWLQLPSKTTVNVVWFTEFPGNRHQVNYGKQLKQIAIAQTTKLSRVREDTESQIDHPPHKSQRDIWRHEAVITGLAPNQRVPYRVTSRQGEQVFHSDVFTLASLPTKEAPLKILLTSDHQLMPMTTANLEQVVKTIGRVDAVFFPGDLVNVPDRASEWFDDRRGGAFFPSLQGKANYQFERNGITTTYHGGEIIQHAPLFTAIGNHEVMGQVSPDRSLKQEFAQPQPQQVATDRYQSNGIQGNDENLAKAEWIKNNSFNTDTYEEIFTLPQSNSGGKKYYATTFGDIRLISLYVTNIWRSTSLAPDIQGRYQESQSSLNRPQDWGYGQHIFEAIAKGSPQYEWLKQELASEAYQQAKYKIVMFHHPPHTLGGNIVPPFTNPQPRETYAEDGRLTSRYYDYPLEDDYIIRDLIPLLESAGVQLVYYGHSHLWNRFQSDSGMHFLESSNVGNSYGAHLGDNKREIPPYNPQNYQGIGDPNGLEPIVPNIAPLMDDGGQPLPYLASNDITAFSIFDTATGTVSSYRYDLRQPDTPAILFDQFKLNVQKSKVTPN
ncbi:MAG: metallophosphoesterase family protein [Hydrococcus sp. SU_1_0]|nr:metallophosphoesterase family protein [Hydrococcus sp. SU_1_0]